MSRGPKPKPTHLHIIEGTLNTTRHRKRLEGEPQPKGDLVDPPAYLSDAQKAIWAEQLQNAPPGLIKKLDWSDYMTWVVACDLYRRALEDVNKFGTLVMTKDGSYAQNPNVHVLHKQSLTIMRASELLGFSPVARARVSVEPAKEINPFDEFA